MLKRRTTLKLGLYGLIGSTLPLDSIAATPDTSRYPAGIKAFFNSRYPESQNFARTLQAGNITLVDSAQDLGTLWYRSLKSELSREPAVLFGMTDRHDLFCLEELARDLGMTTRYRLEHLVSPDGRVQHVSADSAGGHSLDQLLSSSVGFGSKADVLAALALQDKQRHSQSYKQSGPFSNSEHTTLVTWLITR